MADVGLVLLAAGRSRRMGSPKQLLDVGGSPLLRRAAQSALASRCRPVVVVCGASAETVSRAVADLDVQVVRNADWEQGIGTSIRCGIEAISMSDVDAVVLALADQPLLTAGAFDRLVETWGSGGLPIVASEYGDTLGVPALFDRSFFADLLALPPRPGMQRPVDAPGSRHLGALSLSWSGGRYRHPRRVRTPARIPLKFARPETCRPRSCLPWRGAPRWASRGEAEK